MQLRGSPLALLLVACGPGARLEGGSRTLVERVHATPSRSAASGCAFLVGAPLLGGGLGPVDLRYTLHLTHG